ncbi:outer membrane efflux protein [Halothece sp. PCC 7418]|uniref:TolC family protein n=1 Tax=Halothece sp. (strain PCC 7418) TaxID=65093 RepID=UPI0002A07554|nr:TolC family protein [Halothece sp. PCC 7418]AFZ44021.1 outer membrane efflux protein [Halothece sp. PCC 7418]
MLAFRYLFGVSVGALMSLGVGGNATAQDWVSLADSKTATESSFDRTPVSGELSHQPSLVSQPRVADLRSAKIEGFAKRETVNRLQTAAFPMVQPNVTARASAIINLKTGIALPSASKGFQHKQQLAQREDNQPLEEYDESLEPVEETERLNPNSNPLQLPTSTEEVQVEEVVPITLEQAIKLARENNQTLKEARLNLNQAQAQLEEALGTEFPTLSLQTDLQRSTSAANEINANNANFGGTDGPTTDLNTTLQLNYNLYTGGQRPAQIRVAESQVRTQELALEQAAEQLRFDVTDAYYAVQQADSQVEIARAAVADAEQSLRDAQLLEQAGLGTRFDVLQAEVDLANEEQNLTRSISQRRVSRRRLVETLGLGQQVEVTAATPPEVAGTWDLSLEESIVLAYQNRSELEQQLQQREIAQENQTIALAGIKPQVSLFTRYNVLDIIDSGTGGTTGTGDGLAIGAQLQWTLYDGGQSQARARQAEENAAIAENRFDQLRNQIRREVEQAFYDLQANEENIDTARIAVEQGEESLRLARLRFQAGVGTQTDVINAQSALTQARGNLLTAIINYNRSLAALERAVSNFPDGRLFDTP